MKIGLIGHGSIGKRHSRNLDMLGVDYIIHDPALQAGYAFQTLMERCDAFIVASPSEKHSMHVHEITRHPSRPIFVEKPIATSRRQTNDLASLANIFVGYNLRFLRTVMKAKELFEEGRIKPMWARFTCSQFNDKPAYRRDGVILNWSHEIDLALHLLGPAKLKASHTMIQDGQDVLTDIVLEHDSGVTSSIHLDYLTDPQIRGFMIIGETSKVICDIDMGMMIHEKPWSKEMLAEGEFDNCYLREMEQFIDFITKGELGPGCSADEALQVLDICLQVRQQAGLEV